MLNPATENSPPFQARIDGSPRLAGPPLSPPRTNPSTAPDIAGLNREFTAAGAGEVISWAALAFHSGLVMTTSFGIQSAVMLHLATRAAPAIPVIWIDTGYLPPETYRFAEQLTKRLDLNLHVAQPELSPARMEALHGRPWEHGTVKALEQYNRLRKVEPLRRAFKSLGATAWLSGLRADQTGHRRDLPKIGVQDGRVKILPILGWTARDVHFYLKKHGLPYHPLWDQGYMTVGDAHSSRPVTAQDSHERDSRFDGIAEECGIHLPATPGEERSLHSSAL